MKVIHYKSLGAYRIVDYVSPASIDPEATMAKAASFLEKEMSQAEINRVLLEHADYGKFGSDAELVEDDAGNTVSQKLEERGKNRQLTDSLEYIPDFTGVEYVIKENGEWARHTIEAAGIPLPDGSVLADAMTPEQRDELQAQDERTRIASLSAQKKADEKGRVLASARTEARIKKEEAEIADEDFDAKAWYQNRKAEIELKYA